MNSRLKIFDETKVLTAFFLYKKKVCIMLLQNEKSDRSQYCNNTSIWRMYGVMLCKTVLC